MAPPATARPPHRPTARPLDRPILQSDALQRPQGRRRLLALRYVRRRIQQRLDVTSPGVMAAPFLVWEPVFQVYSKENERKINDSTPPLFRDMPTCSNP